MEKPKVEGSSQRVFKGPAAVAVFCLAAAFTLWQLYIFFTTPWPIFPQRGLHILFAFTLIFLLYPFSKKKRKKWHLALDITLALGVVASMARHIFISGAEIPPMDVAMPSTIDIIFSIIFMVVTIEATRRVTGWSLVIVTLGFLAYVFIGPLITGPLAHEGADLKIFITANYLTEIGSLGFITELATSVIFAVVAFGAIMFFLGGGDVMIKAAIALTGKYRGGPAKVAVIGSALFGTISGSPVANVVGTGMFTIPMMKRMGYRPEFAGAVEACASTGGQIMPPVMGTAAFVMIEFLGMSYDKIMLAALIPALFYFGTIFIQVHLEALKRGLMPVAKEEQVTLGSMRKIDFLLLAPILVLVIFLLGFRLPVITSALYATISCWLFYIVHKLIVKKPIDFKHLLISLETPAKMMLNLTAPLVCLGLITYAIDLTGIGSKLSTTLVELSGGNVWAMLVLTMFASLILGMGLPAVACYILLAILAAPGLIQLGLSPVAVHFFVFYFGIISAITPPVCLASYVAAGIAGASGLKTGLQGIKLGLSGYLVPFAFVISPSLLMQGKPLDIFVNSISLLVAAGAIGISVVGFLFRDMGAFLRIVFLAAGILLVIPGFLTDVIGYGLFAMAVLVHYLFKRRDEAKKPATVAGATH